MQSNSFRVFCQVVTVSHKFERICQFCFEVLASVNLDCHGMHYGLIETN